MLKVGIIGSGFGLYGLLPAFKAVKKCRVVAICGKKTERLTSYCKSIGLTHIYTDWQKMLHSEDLDAIALAVTPAAQYTIAKTAIKQGLHIWAEKPLAATYAQAKELLVLAKRNKVINTVDFIFPEIAEWQAVKKIIDQQTYGALRHISVDWDFLSYDIKNKISSWKTDARAGGGALAFYFSHALHYLENFAGEIRTCDSLFSFSKESRNGAEVGVDLIMRFKSGTAGNARIRIDARGFRRHQLVFICEKGTIILENNTDVTKSFAVYVHADGKQKKLHVKKDLSKINTEDERVTVVKKLATKFIRGCQSQTPVYPSFAEGLRVQELIEKIRARPRKIIYPTTIT